MKIKNREIRIDKNTALDMTQNRDDVCVKNIKIMNFCAWLWNVNTDLLFLEKNSCKK